MKSRKGGPSDLTAEKTRHSPAIYANRPLQRPTKPRGQRRVDRLAGIWDDEVVPMLVAAPGLRPIVVFRELFSTISGRPRRYVESASAFLRSLLLIVMRYSNCWPLSLSRDDKLAMVNPWSWISLCTSSSPMT